jgi:L-threonylcarbamoyladenylate synthase
MKTLEINQVPRAELIQKVIEVLTAGGLVIFPTETVYGAGVDATNPTAVEKLLRYKSRREGKPLSIAVSNQEMAEKYVEINDQARKLYQQFMPGPITIISKDRGLLAPGVASEFATVGTRIPDYDLIVEIVKAYGKPITATSANASGKKRPYTVNDILDQLSPKQLSQIDLILDAGKLPPNPPSTIIDTTLSAPVSLRSGSLNFDSKVSLISKNEHETKQIAGRYMLKYWDRIAKNGLIFGLDGPLGAGKTIFAKGVAEFLEITEKITSPTYSYIEEYDFQKHSRKGKFYHLDVWKVNTPEEYQRLEIKKLLKPGTVLVVEWFSQVAQDLKDDASLAGIPIINLEIEDLGDQLRQISLSESEDSEDKI